MSGNKKKHSAKKSEPAAPVSTEPMSAKAYDKELKRLHVELVKLQQWVVAKGLKVCIGV